MSLESLTATSTSQDTLQAKFLYELAFQLIDQGNYHTAAIYFKQIMQKHPTSQYARESALMQKACEKLALAKAQMEQKDTKKSSSSGAAFGGAFLGGALGWLVVLLVIGALSGD